jgi:precorrin-2 dehydrogenase/sirohydrochlorin ferrochelatase
VGDAAKRHYPVFLDLERRLAVVVGDGAPAEKRARQLVRYGADVVVVTASPSEELLQAEADGLLTVEQRAYVRGDLAGAFVALCTSDDDELRRAVFDEADAQGTLVNVAAAPELCSFYLPSVVHREPLQIAVSTQGFAPSVAKSVRAQLAEQYGPEWGPYVTLLAQVRALAFERIEDPAERDRVLDSIAGPELLERMAAGERPDAAELLDAAAPAASAEAADEADG